MENSMLTKEQRLLVYESLLEKMNGDPISYRGLCGYINTLLDYHPTMPIEWSIAGGTGKITKFLPEICSQKPKGKLMNEFWFPRDKEGFNKRIQVVKKAIKLLKK